MLISLKRDIELEVCSFEPDDTSCHFYNRTQEQCSNRTMFAQVFPDTHWTTWKTTTSNPIHGQPIVPTITPSNKFGMPLKKDSATSSAAPQPGTTRPSAYGQMVDVSPVYAAVLNSINAQTLQGLHCYKRWSYPLLLFFFFYSVNCSKSLVINKECHYP